jgi:hypothetical protein
MRLDPGGGKFAPGGLSAAAADHLQAACFDRSRMRAESIWGWLSGGASDRVADLSELGLSLTGGELCDLGRAGCSCL